MTTELDERVRIHLYDRFVAEGRPPSGRETASALGVAEDEAEASYRRLEAARVIVLAPGTTNVWMANPLSAYPTAFRVETERGAFWGSCIWDALGIPPMLGVDGTVRTSCPDCGEELVLRVEEGALQASEVVCHFAVPALRWWENIGYT
jgi:DNA-binding transcriptional MocR family regulator